MALDLYATTKANYTSNNGFIATDKLPSPVSVTPTHEMIWSENTGRAQSGAEQAKMIGDVVAEKKTYAIKWGVLSATEFSAITSKLIKGFFRFGMGTSLSDAKSNSLVVYRSEISYEVLPIGNTVYYKDATVSVIEQ